MNTKNKTMGPAELSEAVALLQQSMSGFAAILAGVTARAEETTERVEAIKLPTRQKAKPKKAKLHPHAHNGVKLTARQWTVWVAVKALFDAKKELTKDSKGFYSLSGQFVAQFIGLPYWEKQEVDRVNSAMASLRRKGLLTWVNERIGKRGRKLKGDIALGPNA
tara:strand:+ start:146 stop:637 length:492 start_codon:yes stop_codon:yes gene_type:complete